MKMVCHYSYHFESFPKFSKPCKSLSVSVSAVANHLATQVFYHGPPWALKSRCQMISHNHKFRPFFTSKPRLKLITINASNISAFAAMS